MKKLANLWYRQKFRQRCSKIFIISICPLGLSSWMPLSPNSYLNFLSSNTFSGSPLPAKLIRLLPHQSTSFCIFKFCQCITNLFPISVVLNTHYASESSKEVFFFFATASGLQDLSFWIRDQTQAPAVKVLSPSHWTTRELPGSFLKRCLGLTPGILFQLVWVGDKHGARFLSSSGDYDTSQVEKHRPYQCSGSDGSNMEPVLKSHCHYLA